MSFVPSPQDAPDEVPARSEVLHLFERQGRSRWQVSARPAAERLARLERLGAAIVGRRDAIAEAIRQDFDKHPHETELTEIGPVLDEIAHLRRHLADWMAPQRVPTPLPLKGGASWVQYEPKGRVLILSPWNYPFHLAMVPVITAVAAGNTVILRPSDKTPRTARCLHDLLADVFPPDEVAVVLGGHVVADALLELPFDHVFFTGSPAVGRKVMAAAARHLASVTLELGGKSPVVVDASADVAVTAERLAWAKFVNAGQTCVAPDYVLVHERVASALEEALAAAIARFYGRGPAEQLASPSYASLVDGRSLARLEAGIAEALQAGARLVTGGLADPARRRLTPTVLADVPDDVALMQDEIFGPVLPLQTFRSLEQALATVRSRPKPLALYLFARDEAVIERVLGATTAGGTCVNHAIVHVGSSELPFGGIGESGMGKYHGWFGFEALSNARAVYRQHLPSSVKAMLPPYGERTRRMLKLLGVLR
jgi:aldehyde dehydrogenase (NAD+)